MLTYVKFTLEERYLSRRDISSFLETSRFGVLHSEWYAEISQQRDRKILLLNSTETLLLVVSLNPIPFSRATRRLDRVFWQVRVHLYGKFGDEKWKTRCGRASWRVSRSVNVGLRVVTPLEVPISAVHRVMERGNDGLEKRRVGLNSRQIE